MRRFLLYFVSGLSGKKAPGEPQRAAVSFLTEDGNEPCASRKPSDAQSLVYHVLTYSLEESETNAE